MKFSIFIIVILLFLRVKYSQSAYGQWISIQIENKAKGHVLEVKNANLDWGKWYGDSKDKEITAPTGTFAYNVKKLSIHVGIVHGVKNRINTVSNRNQLVM